MLKFYTQFSIFSYYMLRFLLYIPLLVVLISACQPLPEGAAAEDQLLAEVFNKRLYSSDLKGMIPSDSGVEDSILITEAFVNRWAREAVLLHQAEQNVPEDWNIDELVEDYRSSLIRHNYEQVLVEQQLDSTVKPMELEAFYERNKEQYQLETPIVRCHFIKIPLEAEGREQAREWWNTCLTDSLSYKELVEYCNLHAEAHVLEDSTWHTLEDIAAALPRGTLTAANIRSKKEFTQRDEQYEYLFRKFEVVNKTEIAPLSYIEGQARRFILKQRKERLVEQTQNQMFQDELKAKNIRLYIE